MCRKQLWMTVEDSRRLEDEVSLRNDKLFVNNETYTWDIEHMRRVMVAGVQEEDEN